MSSRPRPDAIATINRALALFEELLEVVAVIDDAEPLEVAASPYRATIPIRLEAEGADAAKHRRALWPRLIVDELADKLARKLEASVDPGAPLLDRIAKWLELRRAADASSSRGERLKSKAGTLEEGILEEMSQGALESLRVDGELVYTNRDVYASAGPTEELPDLVDVFTRNDLRHFLKVESQSYSAYVRELERSIPADPADTRTTVERVNSVLPPEIAAVTRVAERFRLRRRKA